MNKQIQGINNVDNNPFFTNEQTVNHQPDKFMIDFKNTVPHFVANEVIMVLNHRIIIMDPYMAKLFLATLKDNISKYETKFGEIKKSKQLIKSEKDMINASKEAVTTTAEKPDYMG